MSWRKVATSVSFSIVVTLIGFRVPVGFNGLLLLPGTLVDRVLVELRLSSATSWFAAWLVIYVQVLSWALFWDTVGVLWKQHHLWAQKHATRA